MFFPCCTTPQTSSVPHHLVADCALALVLWTLRSARTHHRPTGPVSLYPLPCRPCPCHALALWHVRTYRTRTSGAQWRLWWRKGVSIFQQKLRLSDTSTYHCCNVCGAYLFSTTACLHKPATFSCPLATKALTWAAFSRPLSCFGFSTRNDVSRLCSRGAMVPCYFTIKLPCAALASHTPWLVGTHHPPFAPVSPRLLLCGSLSHSLPLILSCSLSCALLSLSLSLCEPQCRTGPNRAHAA